MAQQLSTSVLFNTVIHVNTTRAQIWQAARDAIEPGHIVAHSYQYYIFYRRNGRTYGLIMEGAYKVQLRLIVLANVTGSALTQDQIMEILNQIPLFPLVDDDPDAMEQLQSIADSSKTVAANPHQKADDDVPDESDNWDAMSFNIYDLKRPYVTFGLIILNVIVFLFTSANPALLDWGAANSHKIYQHLELYRLVTSTFMHSNAFHLMGNMFAILVIGAIVENFFGHRRFLFIYLGGGMLGSAVAALINGEILYSIGASGAAFTIFGAEMVGLYLYREYTSFQMRDGFRNVFIGGLLITTYTTYVTPEYQMLYGEIMDLSFLVVLFPLHLLSAYIGFRLMKWLFSGGPKRFVFWQILYFGFMIIPFEIPGIDQWAHLMGWIFGIITAFVLAPMLIQSGEDEERIYYTLRNRINLNTLTHLMIGIGVVLMATIFVDGILWKTASVSLPEGWTQDKRFDGTLNLECLDPEIECILSARYKDTLDFIFFTTPMENDRTLTEMQTWVEEYSKEHGYMLLSSETITVDDTPAIQVIYRNIFSQTMEVFTISGSQLIVAKVTAAPLEFEKNQEAIDLLIEHVEYAR